jgi:tetratricopeptide (TPR) repeat protein
MERIIVLDKAPPDIVGALADMFGSAGRHDEALRHWDWLAERHPQLADAHLNRAVTAANAGRPELALAAADSGLERFPGHARLLAIKAMALKSLGRVAESLALFEAAVVADPNRALTRHNQGVALRAACRFDEACEAYAEAGRLGMVGAQFHANWAAAALEAGRVDQAAELYAKALAEDPAHRESLKAMTRLAIEYRGGEAAFAHYEASLRARGGTPAAWLEWLGALAANKRTAEAAAVAQQALAAYPDNDDVRANALSAIGMAGDPAAALDSLGEILRRRPDDPRLLVGMAQLALRVGRPEVAAAQLERLVGLAPDNQSGWALLSLAWRLLDDPREHWLCDYERLVMPLDVPPMGGGSPSAYAREVARALDALHVTLAAPGDQSLRGGTQTSGALFSRPEPAIHAFRDSVLRAAEQAVAALPDDPTHPFLRRKARQLHFAGSWSVRLSSGGHHVSHMHSEGWMSSAYYARLPPPADAGGGGGGHEGWIQFGVPPENLNLDWPPRRIVEPGPGRLVLFPSYMWHGTIPFAAGDRLTAAFDYQPGAGPGA